jgi:PAS domain S-box-containing protein
MDDGHQIVPERTPPAAPSTYAWETLFNAIDSPIWMLDERFVVRRANRAAAELFQRPTEDMLGRHCWEIVHPGSKPMDRCPVVRASESKKRESMELALGEKWFDIVVDVILDGAGRPVGYTQIFNDITPRKRAEQALQTSEKHLRAILEASPHSAFLIDTQGRLIQCNRVTAERLQTDIETLRQGTVFDFLPPEVAATRKTYLRQVSATGTPVRFEDERFGRTFLNSVYPVLDARGAVIHLAVFAEDITERKLADERIRESEERYRNLFDSSQATMLVIDPVDGRIVDANAAACRYYGYAAEQLKARKITQINTLTADEVFEEMARAKAEQRNHFCFFHRLANGEVRPVEVYSGPFAYKGQHLLYSIVHDISERTKVEQEKERLIHELRDALSHIKTLSGLLPICAACKKIRDDQGYWRQIEVYLRAHTRAEFSHSICPECAQKLYPEYKYPG